MAKQVRVEKPKSTRQEETNPTPPPDSNPEIAEKAKSIKDKADKVEEIIDEALGDYEKFGFASAQQYVQSGGQ